MSQNKRWYKTYVYRCPVCGHEEKFKEIQRDTPKPENYEDRIEFITRYDYCNEGNFY